MMLIVAFTFMAAFAHSTLAVRLIPPLSDIMYVQGEANCIDKGGFCMFSPMDLLRRTYHIHSCCGSMGCLYPMGICF
ncbi:hypothetical protein Peur_063379 [Populus x canadensis]